MSIKKQFDIKFVDFYKNRFFILIFTQSLPILNSDRRFVFNMTLNNGIGNGNN